MKPENSKYRNYISESGLEVYGLYFSPPIRSSYMNNRMA